MTALSKQLKALTGGIVATLEEEVDDPDMRVSIAGAVLSIVIADFPDTSSRLAALSGTLKGLGTVIPDLAEFLPDLAKFLPALVARERRA